MSPYHCASRFRPMFQSPSRSGLTLLEMVVVLGILALLATVVVRSLEPIADQSRYETTKRQLETIRQAVADPQPIRHADGSVSFSGFVSDIGRLPVSNGAGVLELAELWDGSLFTTYPFTVRSGPATPIDYSEIVLPCGWRGPYLQPARLEDGLYDGWGNPFLASTEIIRTVEQITAISTTPVGDYNTLESDWSHAYATVSGVLTDGGQPANGTVVLLYPDPTLAELAVMPDSDTAVDGSFVFTEVPVGLRAIHATIGTETIIRYVQVPPGGLTLAVGVNP